MIKPEAQPQGGELKPCPFCAGTKLRVKLDDVAYLKPHCWIVICQGCGANGANRSSEDAAREAWNTRADLPRATAADYEEVLADHRRLVRELDVLLNGDNAAEQASLVDIVAQLRTAPRATGETTVEACLAELRDMFQNRWVEVISGLNAVGNEYYFVRVYGLSCKPSCTSLDEAMAQVRAAAQTKAETE